MDDLEKKILEKIDQACRDYSLIMPGDRILIAVSGGKDSVSLVRLLNDYHEKRGRDFDLALCHVNMKLPDFPLMQLEEFFRSAGLVYYFESIDLLKPGQSMADIDCFWCAWNRRKALFRLSDRIGFNKVAFGHHLDDIVETILMNMFYRSEISAMCPHQELFEGRLTLIRPLAYVEENDIRTFARKYGIEGIDNYQCPNNDTSRRMRMKQLVERLEQIVPQVKENIFNALKRESVLGQGTFN